MIRKLQFGKNTIEYSIRKTNRIKTSEIIVEKKSVLVKSPKTKKLSEIKQLVYTKKFWIMKKQLELQKNQSIKRKFTFDDGTIIPYLGKEFTLKILKGKKNESVILKRDKIVISLKSKKISKIKIRTLYQEWLMKNASRHFKTRLTKFSKKLDLTPKKLNIKNLKSRWGSVTADNTINLNVNLMKAPTSVIDYVILHELCHLKIKGHSYKFWQLLRKFMPKYKEQKLWLEQNDIIVS